MAQKPETRFTRSFLLKLNKIEGSWFCKIQQLSIRGIPDIIGLKNGKFIALELKVGNNKEDKLQGHIMSRIIRCGGFVRVVRPEDAEQVLNDLRAL